MKFYISILGTLFYKKDISNTNYKPGIPMPKLVVSPCGVICLLSTRSGNSPILWSPIQRWRELLTVCNFRTSHLILLILAAVIFLLSTTAMEIFVVTMHGW